MAACTAFTVERLMSLGWKMPKISTNYKAKRAAAQKPDWDIRTDEHVAPVVPPYPAHWIKGQLLNVRNNGSNYIVTPLEEEFDPHHPELAKFFDNSFDAQAFVSEWYNRDAHDPRA